MERLSEKVSNSLLVRYERSGTIQLGMLSFFILLACIVFFTEIAIANPLGRAVDATQVAKIESARIKYQSDFGILVFEMDLEKSALEAIPAARGSLDTAPVMGFVFPTTLNPADVGFKGLKGIVALAVTSHPDFDDTPLWDENLDKNYANDGIIFHPHWVLLQKDSRVSGGFSVVQFDENDTSVSLPPTNPGMPIALDSPGFQVIVKKKQLKVIVPEYRINSRKAFNFDALTCYLEVNTSDPNRPMLGVYKVYEVKSGDLSLPFSVTR